MLDPHYEIMSAEKSGAGLGRSPTENNVSELDNTVKQSVIAQHSLMSKMLELWINKYFTT